MLAPVYRYILDILQRSVFSIVHHFFKILTGEPFWKCRDQYKYFQKIFITQQKTKTPFNRLIKQKAPGPRYDRPHIPQLGTVL